jgi:hypothetical protein
MPDNTDELDSPAYWAEVEELDHIAAEEEALATEAEETLYALPEPLPRTRTRVARRLGYTGNWQIFEHGDPGSGHDDGRIQKPGRNHGRKQRNKK